MIPIVCPNCNSQIGVTLLCGSTGSNKHQYVCRKCGHVWSVEFTKSDKYGFEKNERNVHISFWEEK